MLFNSNETAFMKYIPYAILFYSIEMNEQISIFFELIR